MGIDRAHERAQKEGIQCSRTVVSTIGREVQAARAERGKLAAQGVKLPQRQAPRDPQRQAAPHPQPSPSPPTPAAAAGDDGFYCRLPPAPAYEDAPRVPSEIADFERDEILEFADLRHRRMRGLQHALFEEVAPLVEQLAAALRRAREAFYLNERVETDALG